MREARSRHWKSSKTCQLSQAADLCIQEHHCWPVPKGPPANTLKMGSILAKAPPSLAKTMPVRIVTTLFVLAFFAAASHSLQTSAR